MDYSARTGSAQLSSLKWIHEAVYFVKWLFLDPKCRAVSHNGGFYLCTNIGGLSIHWNEHCWSHWAHWIGLALILMPYFPCKRLLLVILFNQLIFSESYFNSNGSFRTQYKASLFIVGHFHEGKKRVEMQKYWHVLNNWQPTNRRPPTHKMLQFN